MHTHIDRHTDGGWGKGEREKDNQMTFELVKAELLQPIVVLYIFIVDDDDDGGDGHRVAWFRSAYVIRMFAFVSQSCTQERAQYSLKWFYPELQVMDFPWLSTLSRCALHYLVHCTESWALRFLFSLLFCFFIPSALTVSFVCRLINALFLRFGWKNEKLIKNNNERG